MANGNDRRVGMWEVPEKTLWVQDAYSKTDVFLAHSSMLIHGAMGEVRILHLLGKDPREAPYGWDEKLRIPPTFLVYRTTRMAIRDSLFLLGGESNPQEGQRLDLFQCQLAKSPSDDGGERGRSFDDVGPPHHPRLGGEGPRSGKIPLQLRVFGREKWAVVPPHPENPPSSHVCRSDPFNN